MKELIEKVLSGRFILTVIVGIIILVTCLRDPQIAKEFKEIFLVVIYAYFSKPRDLKV